MSLLKIIREVIQCLLQKQKIKKNLSITYKTLVVFMIINQQTHLGYLKKNTYLNVGIALQVESKMKYLLFNYLVNKL